MMITNGQALPGPRRGLVTRAGCAALAVACVAVTACSAAAAPPAPVWQPCGTGLDCATVTVPVDYGRPGGAALALGLIRHRATDPGRRLGSLLVNPGGPGVAAGDQVRMIAETWPGVPQPFGPELLARYDIVGMDPRGVGSSGQVRCFADEQREQRLATDLDPAVPGGLPGPELASRARDVGAACARTTDLSLLGQLSTDNVARDMDQVRAALGEETISYLGTSYGTLLGATYATLYPGRVRHMVLDAPVHPERWQQDPLGASVDQAVAGEQLLQRYLATCLAEGPNCPFGGGRPAAAFDALVQRLEAQPLSTPPAGDIPGGRVDGAVLLVAARVAMFDHRLWPVLTLGLVAAESGDGAVLRQLATALLRGPDGRPNGLEETNLSINCVDRAVPRDIAEHDRNAEQIRSQVARFGTVSGYVALSCATWPVQNPDRYLGPLTGAGAPPILVIGGREDAQTPYPWAQAMAERIESGVLLTREGVGHGAYRSSGPCIDDAVERFLLSGTTPADGTTCPQLPAPTTNPAAVDG